MFSIDLISNERIWRHNMVDGLAAWAHAFMGPQCIMFNAHDKSMDENGKMTFGS